MKKIISFSLVCVLLLGCVFAFSSCSKVTESYADKINKAAENGEHFTVEDVRKDLGDEAVEILILNSGVIVAVKGCATLDEIEDKIDNDETVKGIVITVLAGKATAATYKEISKDDLK